MSLVEEINPREHIGANRPPETTAEVMALEHAEVLAEVDAIEAKLDKLPKRIRDDVDQGRVAEVGVAAAKLAKRIEGVRKSESDPHYQKHKEIVGFFATFLDRLETLKKELEQRATDYVTAKAAEKRRELEAAARKAEEDAEKQRQIARDAEAKGQAGKALKHDDKAEELSDRAWRTGIAAQASAADLTRVRSATGALATSRGSWTHVIEDQSKIPLEMLRPYIPAADLDKFLRSFVKANQDRVPLAGVRIFKETKAAFR